VQVDLFVFTIFDSMKIYSLIAVAFLFGSCQKTKFPSDYSKQLIGTWERQWLREDQHGPLQDSQDLGEVKTYKFKENARYIESLDGKRALRGDYHIISEVQDESVRLFMEHEDSEFITVRFDVEEQDDMYIYFLNDNKEFDLEYYKRID